MSERVCSICGDLLPSGTDRNNCSLCARCQASNPATVQHVASGLPDPQSTGVWLPGRDTSPAVRTEDGQTVQLPPPGATAGGGQTLPAGEGSGKTVHLADNGTTAREPTEAAVVLP